MKVLEIFLLLLLIYIFLYYYKYFTRRSPLPGPFPLPFIGNMLELFKAGGDFATMSISMHKKYGDIWEFYVFSDRQIWLSRNKLMTKFFDKKLTRNLYFKRATTPGLRDIGLDSHGIVFVNDFERWRINRKFFTQALLTAKFRKDVIPTIQAVFSDMEKMWLRLDHTKPIDMAKWSKHITADAIFRVSLHRDLKIMAGYFNTLVPDEKKIPELSSNQHFESGFVELLQSSVSALLFLMLFPNWVRHYVPWFRQKNKRVIREYYEMCSRIETQIIKKRRVQIENTPMEQDLPNDLLTQLCIINTPRSEVKIENAGECKPMTEFEICRIMNDAFLGATDATSNSLCFIIYYLCKYPRVKACLLKEFETVFGTNFDQSITSEHLDKLTYLDAVMKEARRLIPTIHMNVRVSSVDDEVGGYIFPAGTSFVADILNRNRHPEDWSDAEEFIPERWLNSDGVTLKEDFTFGGGVRECPGRYLAETEFKVILALLYMKFDVKLANESEKLKCSSDFAVFQCSELKVFIKQNY